MSLFNNYIEESLGELKEANLLRNFRVIEKVKGPYVRIERKDCLCFCSNDYLGLAQHPAVIGAGKLVADEYGWGTGASRLLSGTTLWHEQLEKKIAQFKDVQSALYFSSGYMANLALITAITDRDTLIVEDKLNHASLIDATRLANAKIFRFNHCDSSHAAQLLKENSSYKRRLIVTDAVFSMDGDIAKVGELLDVARDFEAEIIIDDAHGTGVLGKNGRGTLEYLGLEGKVNIATFTFSKALGSVGGVVIGSEKLVALVRSRGRSFIFTTSLPPAIPASGIAAIELLGKEPQLREKLWENVNYIKAKLKKLGFDLRGSEAPIIPILIGSAEKTLKIANTLWENGIFTPAIRPPTVPEGQSRLRISITAMHEKEHLDKLVDLIKEHLA